MDSIVSASAVKKIALQLPRTTGRAGGRSTVGGSVRGLGGNGCLALPIPTTKISLTHLHNSVSAHGPQPKGSSCEKQVSRAFSINRNKQKCSIREQLLFPAILVLHIKSAHVLGERCSNLSL